MKITEKHVADEGILSRALRATRYLFGSKGMRLNAAIGIFKPGVLSKADAKTTKRSTGETNDIYYELGEVGFGAKGRR